MAKADGNDQKLNIRKCSFEPENYLIEIDSMRGDGTKEKYLKVQYRILWFNIYCAENGIFGFIDTSDVKYHSETGMYLAWATICMDGCNVAKAVAALPYTAENASSVVMSVTTKAIGRALANCGFGTAMCALEDGDDGQPCDSGIPVQKTAPVLNDIDLSIQNDEDFLNGLNEKDAPPEQISFNISDKTSTPVKKAFRQTTLQTNPQNKQTSVKLPVTLEEARAVVIDSGSYQGKTLGELAVINFKFIEFYATKYNAARRPDLKKGAEIILAEYNAS